MRKIKLNRGQIILCFYISVFFILSIRLYFLQVHPTEQVVTQYKNHQTENISDMDYMILDTNGKDLMEYNKKYVLVIDSKPFSLNNYEETLEDLMALNFIMKGEDSEFNYTDIMKSEGKLYYRVSLDTYNKINRLENLKGIYTYVYDEVDRKEAWSVSGMLSDIGEKKAVDNSFDSELLSILKTNETPKQNFYLDDKAIYSKDELDVKSDNKNIKLTIDKELEDKIRKVLSKEEYLKFNNIGVTLMESDTGKIRAMMQKNESEPNINLGMEVSGFEPGSIYKLITYGVALEKGIVNTNNFYSCSGEICKTVHGSMSVNEALVKSCNDIFGKLGNEIGYEDIMRYSEKLGIFNRVLNIQSQNKNEASGIKPLKEAGMNNIAIGQCMTTTPIQMLGAVNTFVNNGTYIKPYILDSIVDTQDKVVKRYDTKKEEILSETTSKLVTQGMKEVVNRGTGIEALIKGINMGGKTGSATSGEGNTHGWFVGYFEARGHKYTMIVFLPELQSEKENDLGGGNTAAPIFRDIVEEIK